jgi:hypothetical protein
MGSTGKIEARPGLKRRGTKPRSGQSNDQVAPCGTPANAPVLDLIRTHRYGQIHGAVSRSLDLQNSQVNLGLKH